MLYRIEFCTIGGRSYFTPEMDSEVLQFYLKALTEAEDAIASKRLIRIDEESGDSVTVRLEAIEVYKILAVTALGEKTTSNPASGGTSNTANVADMVAEGKGISEKDKPRVKYTPRVVAVTVEEKHQDSKGELI